MRPHEYAAFADALVDPAAPVPSGLLVPHGVRIEERFAVYRNNVHASLVDALEESFPVTRALVGAPFFREMARAHVQQQLPRDADLLAQAAGFAAFVRRYAPAGELAWLPDVATLESTWQECWSAADSRVLDIADLAQVPPAVLCTCRFLPHPAARLIRSPWPIGSIWHHHQEPHPDLGGLCWQPENVLLTRPHAEVLLVQLPAGTAAMAAALLAGLPLDVAAAGAAEEDPDMDPGLALHALIRNGIAMETLPSCST